MFFAEQEPRDKTANIRGLHSNKDIEFNFLEPFSDIIKVIFAEGEREREGSERGGGAREGEGEGGGREGKAKMGGKGCERRVEGGRGGWGRRGEREWGYKCQGRYVSREIAPMSEYDC